MYKISSMALLALFLFSFSSAKPRLPKRLPNQLSIGLRAGIESQRTREEIVLEDILTAPENTTNGCFGLYVAFGINKKLNLGLETEVLFFTKKASFSNEQAFLNATYEYFSIPVNLQWLIAGNVFYFSAGMEFNYLLNKKLDAAFTNNFRFSDSDFNTAANVGFGLSIRRYNISVKYKYDLTGNNFTGLRILLGVRLLRFKNAN